MNIRDLPKLPPNDPNRPWSPDLVRSRKTDCLPKAVIRAANKLLVQNLGGNGMTSQFTQEALVAAIIEEDAQITEKVIFDKGYLNIEPVYRAHGWSVDYDKPAYNESYKATYYFKEAK